MIDHRDRLRGLLLGTALGDALGLPCEGLKAARVALKFPKIERFRLVGRRGYVSDDTEQSALVAQSLLRGGDDDAAVVRAFRSALRGWFWRLPFGIGGATLRACLRLTLGLRSSGVASAGNGAAMRAAILGPAVGDTDRRRRLGEALARVTHTDARAVEAAVFCAELAAQAARASADADRAALYAVARAGVRDAALAAALDAAVADGPVGVTGFVLHSAPVVAWAFVTHGHDPLAAIRATIRLGGDTDTHAAMVGALCGALHGEGALPAELIGALAGGPFGPRHLRGLADALATGGPPPRFSALAAFARNLALYPVILGHGFRRLLP